LARKGDDPGRIEDPDIEVGASVKAKKLRFRSKPETEVEFHGEAEVPEGRSEVESASGSERKNLPEEVEPGVTYKDVRVRWGAAARIEDPGGESDEEQDEG
jgi:hypothetical protein